MTTQPAVPPADGGQIPDTTPGDSEGGTESSAGTQPVLTPLASGVALALIVFYLAGLAYLVANRGDQQWERLTFLFQGLEALVFAGAGALFGTRVQRQQAVAAKAEADSAKQDAAKERVRATLASAKAMQGEMIAVLAKSKRDRTRQAMGARMGAREDQTPAPAPITDMDELGALADRFFPEA